MATNGPEAWLGRRVIASGPVASKPLKQTGRAPEAAAGAFLFFGCSAADEPGATAREDGLEVALADGAEPTVDRAQEP